MKYNLKKIIVMKKSIAFVVLVVLAVSVVPVKAQEWSTGLDIYSSYIWRGAKFGTGPAFQPFVDYTTGGLSVGAWGSVNASADEALEMDLYLSYSFDFGLTVGLTDYYFGIEDGDSIGVSDGDVEYDQLGFLDYGELHYLEPMVSYSIGNFSLTAAYMLLPDFSDGDTYLEAAYAFGPVDLTVGAGDGAYTADGAFNVCNLSLGTSKEISITDKFSLPVSGSVTLNPSTGGFYIAVGVSL